MVELEANASKKSHSLISKSGIVILHDANRIHYHNHMGLFSNQALFTDSRKGRGGIWIGSISRPIDSVVDISKFRSIWKKHGVSRKIFKLE